MRSLTLNPPQGMKLYSYYEVIFLCVETGTLYTAARESLYTQFRTFLNFGRDIMRGLFCSKLEVKTFLDIGIFRQNMSEF